MTRMQAQKEKTKKIFVGGVPVDMEKPAIEEYFKQFGEVKSIVVGIKWSRGFFNQSVLVRGVASF